VAERLHYRRGFTTTPLARRYERTLAAQGRRKRAIPWGRFDPSRYPPAALALAGRAYRELAANEYAAAAVFARVLDAMILYGAPLDLLAEAAQAPLDELRHADHALRIAALCGAEEGPWSFDRERIDPARSHAQGLVELDAVIVDVSAIGETIAAALLGESQRRALDPVISAALTAIAADEVHHARLGWYYLAWRAPRWTPEERQRVADHAAAVVADVRLRTVAGHDAPSGAEEAAAALGVLDAASRRDTIVQVMDEEIVPGLDSFGLNATYAWQGSMPDAR
jgi:hypothetical protein